MAKQQDLEASAWRSACSPETFNEPLSPMRVAQQTRRARISFGEHCRWWPRTGRRLMWEVELTLVATRGMVDGQHVRRWQPDPSRTHAPSRLRMPHGSRSVRVSRGADANASVGVGPCRPLELKTSRARDHAPCSPRAAAAPSRQVRRKQLAQRVIPRWLGSTKI
jgi:hypothetical protein